MYEENISFSVYLWSTTDLVLQEHTSLVKDSKVTKKSKGQQRT